MPRCAVCASHRAASIGLVGVQLHKATRVISGRTPSPWVTHPHSTQTVVSLLFGHPWRPIMLRFRAEHPDPLTLTLVQPDIRGQRHADGRTLHPVLDLRNLPATPEPAQTPRVAALAATDRRISSRWCAAGAGRSDPARHRGSVPLAGIVRQDVPAGTRQRFNRGSPRLAHPNCVDPCVQPAAATASAADATMCVQHQHLVLPWPARPGRRTAMSFDTQRPSRRDSSARPIARSAACRGERRRAAPSGLPRS